MNKKKAIKIATAATIAASAFVAAAPAQTSAAFNADTAVKNARTQMYNLYQSYSQPGATFVSWNKFNSDLKKAVANYNSVKSQVSKSNAKNKKQLLQALDFSYNVYVKDYAQSYINARTAAGKLMDAITKLEASTKEGNLDATNLNYASVTKEAAATNTLAKKIHGATISKRFTDYYAKLAQDAKNVVIYELTIYTNYKNAEKALADNDTAKAQAFMDKVDPHFKNIKSDSELGKNLLKYVDEVKAKFAPKVTSVMAINETTVKVTFDKEVTAENAKGIKVLNGSKEVAYTAAVEGKVATLTLEAPFYVGTTLTVEFDGVAKEVTGTVANPELTDVENATKAVVALEEAVKDLKEENIANAEAAVVTANEALKAVDTASVKEDLSSRIADAEVKIADAKKAADEAAQLAAKVKAAQDAVAELVTAAADLKDDAAVTAAEVTVTKAQDAVKALPEGDENIAVLTAKIEAAQAKIIAAKAELAKPVVAEVSAINETSVQVTVPTTVKEADLSGKQVTLKSGEAQLTATYVESSLTDKGIATFKLDNDAKLVDAKTYTASASWAKIASAEFVSKVATPYVASFEKVTTGITATDAQDAGDAVVTFAAKNQYGEEIAFSSVNTLKVEVTLNGALPLVKDTDFSVDSATGKVTITKDLKETDDVSIKLVNSKTVEGQAVELASTTFDYKVLKAEAPTVTSVTLNTVKTSLPAKEATALTVKVLDKYNNELTGGNSAVTFVVNGKIVSPGAETDLIQLNDGKYTFKTSTPGEYKVVAISAIDSKVKAEATITVGAATLTGLTATQTNSTSNNHEAVELGTVAPSESAALVADNLKFNVTSTTTGVTAADVQVTATTDKDGKIVVSATASKTGNYTITPYVGESFIAETAIKGNAFSLTSKVNAEVASISDVTFDAKELKVGSQVKKEIVFKNKHGEVLTAEQANASITSSAASVVANPGEGSATAIVQGTEANADKTYLVFTPEQAGTTQLTVQAGNELKSYKVTVVDSIVSTIDAGADVTGVVAGDDTTLAKYNNVSFLDQDGIALTNEPLTADNITVEKADGTKLTAGEAAKLVTVNTSNVTDKDGKVVNAANKSLKVLPVSDVAAGTYKVTVSKVIDDKTVSNSFNVTVGAARAITKLTVNTPSSQVALNGEKSVILTPQDQYGQFKKLVSKNGVAVTFANNPALVSQVGDLTPIDKDGKTVAFGSTEVGYKLTLQGDTKGSETVTYTIGSGDTAVKATTSVTVNSVGSLVNSVAVNKEDLKALYSTINNGETVNLSAKAFDASGNPVAVNNSDFVWSSVSVNPSTDNTSSATVKVDPDGTVTADPGFDGSVTVKVQSSNLKSDTITLKFSKVKSAPVTGTTAVTSSVAEALDSDTTKAGIQVALDGKGTDEANGAVAFTLDGVDQYGDTFDITESDAIVTTEDSSVVTIGKAGDKIAVTAKGEGSTKVYVQYNGDTIAIDFTVAKDAVALATAKANLDAATSAVVKAEESKLQADVAAAKKLVDALPADVAPATTKADLQARVAAVTAPVISNVRIVSNNADNTKAMVGDTITLTFKSDKPVTKLGNFKINGSNPETFVDNHDGTYTVTHLVDAGDHVGDTATFQINVQNAAGVYSQTVEQTTDGSSVSIIAQYARISNVHVASDNGDPTKAVDGDTITLTFTSDVPVTKENTFRISGGNPDTFTNVGNVGNVYTVTHTVDAGDARGAATFQINVKNAAGILSPTVEQTTDASSVVIQ